MSEDPDFAIKLGKRKYGGTPQAPWAQKLGAVYGRSSDMTDDTAIQAASGTRHLQLRSVSVATDCMTGAPGCPDGPWKSYKDDATPPVYTVPLPHHTGHREVSYDAKTVAAAKRHTCFAPMLTQITNQCYVAAAINMLLAVPEVKALMYQVFKKVKKQMPAVFALLSAPISPASVSMPLGLALLQVMYNVYRRREFTPSLAAAILEERMLGTASSVGGYPDVALCTMLSALGLDWTIENEDDKAPDDINTLFFIQRLALSKYGAGAGMIRSLVLPGKRCVGALISITQDDNEEDIGHVIAALDCDAVFDSNLASTPTAFAFAFVPWRERSLTAVVPPGFSCTQAAIVYMSQVPPKTLKRVADRVAMACLGTHRINPITMHVIRGAKGTSSMLALDKTPIGALHGEVELHTSNKHIVGWFHHGDLQRDNPLWPAMILASTTSKSVTFVWPDRRPPLPQILKLRAGPPPTFSYQMRADPTVEGKIVEPIQRLNPRWLPAQESIPKTILRAHAWLQKLLAEDAAVFTKFAKP
jgi:hypothetical protein